MLRHTVPIVNKLLRIYVFLESLPIFKQRAYRFPIPTRVIQIVTINLKEVY